MRRDEITSAITVGAWKEVYVLLDRPSEIPGYVRSISLHAGNRVQVAFEVEGLDEGGAYFWGVYPTHDDAISALEQFLGKPVEDWAVPYLEPSGQVAPDHHALEDAIRKRGIRFPVGAEFKLQDSYWSQFSPADSSD